MNSKPYAIGVLGGMGTYATIHLFRQYAEMFPAEKEWDRPRIIIDNRCTMPSRVRAALYGENRERLIRDGGKLQVPCLFIDGKPLYESDDIVAWLRANP